VIHVLDASRAVGVASKLLSDTQRDAYVAEVEDEYIAVRDARAGRTVSALLTLDEARANAFPADMAAKPAAPAQPGLHVFPDWSLEHLRGFIDWTPFFLRLFRDNARAEVLATLHTLRQQTPKRDGRTNTALADFVAPEGVAADWVGGFVVTTGAEEIAIAERFEKANDDYAAIMVKALADRFAEALAECLHERVRKRPVGAMRPKREASPLTNWSPNPTRGIRPAPGLPCPTRPYGKAHPLAASGC
jgi:5-methyltetrahydrofolate--homocysteine methyltransferase